MFAQYKSCWTLYFSILILKSGDDSIHLKTLHTNKNLGFDFDDAQMSTFQNNNQLADFGSDFQQAQSHDPHKNQQMQLAMEQDVNLTQLKEREAALRRLENDIVDVNMIFKDLAVMVHDQGEIIDSIESNVEQVQIRVTEANSSLEGARKNQVILFLIIYQNVQTI